MKKLGLVVAMEVEAMNLIKELELQKVDDSNNVYIRDNSFGQYSSITLIVSGIGMENSAIATQILVLIYGVERVLNFGYAGSNKVKIGSIVSPNKVFNNDFDLTIMGHEKYKIPGVEDLILSEISEYDNYSCYSANHFVTKSEENQPVIYDMELHGIAMVCNRNKISLSAIKVVTDSLDADRYNKNETDIKFVEILSQAVIKNINK